MKITVIGCGNGAFATAADLSYRGHEITLFIQEAHKSNFDEICQSGIINCSGKGPVGPVKIHKITTDVEEALKNNDLIIPVVPTFAHEDIANIIVPYIKKGDKIFLSPGGTGGALVFAKVFQDYNKLDGVKIAEVHTLPYTARKVAKDTVNISLITKILYFSAFPAKYNQEMYDFICPLYPNIKMMRDVLEVGLNNGNGVTHPAPVVLNAGKIEYYGKHYHYKEGITPSVGNVVQLIDDERKHICKVLGYCEIDIKDRLYEMGYCPKKNTVYECIQGSKDVFLPLEGPNDLNGRYLVEDTPYTLVCMASIARKIGVDTPLMNAVVNLSSALKNEDYWKTGRSIEKLGLNGMSIEEMKYYLKYGID